MNRKGSTPGSEALRRAVAWLSDHGRHDATAIEEACRRFDLSPADEEFLLRECREPHAGRAQAAAVAQRVRAEIVELHEHFVTWYAGRCDADDATFERFFSCRFSPDFAIVLPAGTLHAGVDFLPVLRAGHGSNADFRICIRDVRVREAGAGLVVATYEEWQRNARNSSPADNARLTTAVLVGATHAPRRFAWLHAHETWLPSSVLTADRFEF
ncbi:MAG: hypothetical protein IT495_00185 [Gammaproteobacteria bacterium]|nr:hypothetical protein [Gammaproteobacteria bacterium]